MFRKEKIFVFLTVLFSIVVLFTTLSFADTEDVLDTNSLVYTGNDGRVYNLPPLPEELVEYNHYVILFEALIDEFFILPFNDTFEVVENGANDFNILLDGENFSKFYWVCDFRSVSSLDSWSTGGSSVGGAEFRFSKIRESYYVVDTCSCMSSYSNNLENAIDGTDSFFLNRNQVLVPIMEKTPLEGVLQEIVEILPVVLVTLVGLIGLRKALQMLSAVLHRS